MDMSTPVFPEVDFLISLIPLEKVWGRGDCIHSEHLGVQLWLLRRRIDVIWVHDMTVSNGYGQDKIDMANDYGVSSGNFHFYA